MTRPEEPDEARHLRELHDLLAAGLAADVAKLGYDLEGLTLTDWASRTIAAAEDAGRPDIAAETRALVEEFSDAQAALDAATRRRQDSEARSRKNLSRHGNQF